MVGVDDHGVLGEAHDHGRGLAQTHAVAHLEPHMEKADTGGKGRIVLATNRSGEAVTAEDPQVAGAMTVLLYPGAGSDSSHPSLAAKVGPSAALTCTRTLPASNQASSVMERPVASQAGVGFGLATSGKSAVGVPPVWQTSQSLIGAGYSPDSR